MRIWDLDPKLLCNKHLLGEHRELHAIWSVIINGKKGYSKHPETLRWFGKLHALYEMHEKIVGEMLKRGFAHKSPLNKEHATGQRVQDEFVNTYDEQIEILKKKGCDCRVK